MAGNVRRLLSHGKTFALKYLKGVKVARNKQQYLRREVREVHSSGIDSAKWLSASDLCRRGNG